MSDITTVTLDGGELKVEGLNGQNTEIINKSGGAVYASKCPGVVPEADGVIEIAANTRDGLHGTNGTLYLLGTGKVELRGTDYSVNFRKPSSSTGGGGGTPTAELYGDAEFTNTIGSEYAYTIPVAKGQTPADTAYNYAKALAALLGGHWKAQSYLTAAYLVADNGAEIKITGLDNGIILFQLFSKNGSYSADESYNVSQNDSEHYIDVIKSSFRKVICVSTLHTVMINYVFSDYDTAEPYIWQKSSEHDFYRANTLGELQWIVECRTCKGDKTSLGTGYSGMNGNMYNVFSMSCSEDYLKNNRRVFMNLNGKNYTIFGRFNDGILSNTINYRSLLAIPLD